MNNRVVTCGHACAMQVLRLRLSTHAWELHLASTPRPRLPWPLPWGLTARRGQGVTTTCPKRSLPCSETHLSRGHASQGSGTGAGVCRVRRCQKPGGHVHQWVHVCIRNPCAGQILWICSRICNCCLIKVRPHQLLDLGQAAPNILHYRLSANKFV